MRHIPKYQAMRVRYKGYRSPSRRATEPEYLVKTCKKAVTHQFRNARTLRIGMGETRLPSRIGPHGESETWPRFQRKNIPVPGRVDAPRITSCPREHSPSASSAGRSSCRTGFARRVVTTRAAPLWTFRTRVFRLQKLTNMQDTTTRSARPPDQH